MDDILFRPQPINGILEPGVSSRNHSVSKIHLSDSIFLFFNIPWILSPVRAIPWDPMKHMSQWSSSVLSASMQLQCAVPSFTAACQMEIWLRGHGAVSPAGSFCDMLISLSAHIFDADIDTYIFLPKITKVSIHANLTEVSRGKWNESVGAKFTRNR